MKNPKIFLILIFVTFYCFAQTQSDQPILIDDAYNTEFIDQIMRIDSVWAGHPVNFSLYTYGNRQYIAYYNAKRNIVVGQRNLDDSKFKLYTMLPTSRRNAAGTSTVLGWDSHNSLTMGIDKDSFIHLSGNMHGHPITYFKSTKPNDIFTLIQERKLVGRNEKRCTYPHFMLSKEGELLFHYRDGSSGNGNEIYNIYSCETKKWSRMLDVPLTDGQRKMNAYQTEPTVMKDGWYHVYWVWRDTPDCSTNHDLSYMKSPDLKHWFDAFGNKVKLPATLSKKSLIVDPIPVKGGIINLAAILCLDENNNPVFVYHKFDTTGNTQLFIAHIVDNKWVYKQITDWDYRWYFSGKGSIDVEISINDFRQSAYGNYEVDYWHVKYGNGTILLNEEFENIGNFVKLVSIISEIRLEGNFPGLHIMTINDEGKSNEKDTRYMLKWETLDRNRDQARPKPWPNPSQLYLYKLKKTR